MITAEQLQTLSTFTTEALGRAVGSEFDSSKFLGITNGGQFCYSVTYVEHGDQVKDKVFLNYNPAEGRVSAVLG